MKRDSRGFTLIEFLIIIAIIAILAAVVFVALDPLTRFQDTRDSRRWSDITSVLDAVKVDQVDNGGSYLSAISTATSTEVYMITSDGTVLGCDDNCDGTNPNNLNGPTVTSDTHCIDLSGLITEGYLAEIAISPNGDYDWDASTTGYTLSVSAQGAITIESCEAENTAKGILIKK